MAGEAGKSRRDVWRAAESRYGRRRVRYRMTDRDVGGGGGLLADRDVGGGGLLADRAAARDLGSRWRKCEVTAASQFWEPGRTW